MVVVFLASLLCGAANSFSQNAGSTSAPKKNAISLLISYHDFYDGHPMFQQKPKNAAGYKPVVKGLEYQRMIGSRWGFEAGFKVINHLYWDANDLGDVRGRRSTFWELNLLYRIWARKGVSLLLLGGPSLRFGSEEMLTAMDPRGWFYDFYRLRDPGITAGLRMQYDLPTTFTVPVLKNFTFAGEGKFTQIIWRYNSSLPNRTYYPNRSTRQMFTLQFGLGYRF